MLADCNAPQLCDAIVHVDCEPRSDQPFFGEMRADMAGEIRGATYSSVAQIVTRSPRKIADRPADILTLGVHLAGHGFGSQDGRDIVLRPGDLVLYDMARPFRLSFSDSFLRTTLIFPRAALMRRLGGAERFIGIDSAARSVSLAGASTEQWVSVACCPR
jgi:hypothetical protein